MAAAKRSQANQPDIFAPPPRAPAQNQAPPPEPAPRPQGPPLPIPTRCPAWEALLASCPAAACPLVIVANYWPRRILETLSNAEDGWHALYRDGTVRLIGRHSGPLRHVNANPTMARAWHEKRELIVVESAKECVTFRFGDKPGDGALVFPAGFRLIEPTEQRAA